MQIPIEKIKAKYQNLQATSRKISQAEFQTTGNVKLPKKPSFFDALVDHFGNRQGMAHRCLNSSELANRSDEQSHDSDSGDEAQSRSLVFTPTSANPSRNLPKASKNDAVAMVGKKIREGLVERSERMASALTSSQPSFGNDISKIKQLLKVQAKQSTETNQLLRYFMQFMMQKNR